MSETDGTSRSDRIDRQLEFLALSQTKTENTLRRAIASGVREARRQPARSRELEQKFDQKMEQLAGAQLLTEEKLKVVGERLELLINALLRGRNGHE